MKNMTKFIALSAMTLAISAVACGDDETGTGGGTSTGATTSTGGNGGNGGGNGGMGGMDAPPPPTLGTQIDRMGRAAIATATYERFVAPDTHADAVDVWNQDDDPGAWAGAYVPNVASQIAILDGLDQSCGDQLLYDGTPVAPATCPDDGNGACYGIMGTVLANDWIVLKVNGADDPSYLGAEANLLGVPGDSRGGRMPAHDVIDVSYSILSGLFDFSMGAPFLFGDNVDAPPQSQVESFPYLAAPN
jgi:hypothetical protein